MDVTELLTRSQYFLSRGNNAKKEDILSLREIVREHNNLYYQKESPIISDEEYDKLFHLLARLEADYNMLDEDSPTAHLAILTSEQFQKVKHLYPMISLDNTYSTEDVRDFENRMRNILLKKFPEIGDFSYYIQPKYDGLGLALIYKNGILTQGITRGSGIEGEDVTLGAREIKNIPKNIDALKNIERMEIRGEVMMSRKTFECVNTERMEKGEKLFANPRNAASGSLRQLDPLVTRSRNLEFFAYSVPQIEQHTDFEIKKYHELMDLLRKWGFERQDFDFSMIQGIDNLDKCIKEQTEWYLSEKNEGEEREYFDFDIDGMVIKLDDMILWEVLGKTEHHPRYAIAYKFPAKQVRTTVLSIEHSVGRTGTVTPVANLEPVEVTGVMVKRATLHNYDELVKKGVREGDKVFIMRAGEVIPEVVSVITELRNGTEKEIFPPENCPICKTKLEKEEGKVAIFCPNILCPAKIQGQMEMFVSKQGLNIDGLGARQIELFLGLGYITDFTSIFYLGKYRDKILELDGYKEKSVNNLLDSIERARSTTLDKIITALGIPNIGKKTAKQIAVLFLGITTTEGVLEKIFSLREQELLEVKDIGPETAKSFVMYFGENKEQVRGLFGELQFSFEGDEDFKKTILLGKSFCVTGSFANISRNEIHTKIEQNGGEVRTTVSSQLDYLIVGYKAGAKKKKAEALGISVIDFGEFLKMTEG